MSAARRPHVVLSPAAAQPVLGGRFGCWRPGHVRVERPCALPRSRAATFDPTDSASPYQHYPCGRLSSDHPPSPRPPGDVEGHERRSATLASPPDPAAEGSLSRWYRRYWYAARRPASRRLGPGCGSSRSGRRTPRRRSAPIVLVPGRRSGPRTRARRSAPIVLVPGRRAAPEATKADRAAKFSALLSPARVLSPCSRPSRLRSATRLPRSCDRASGKHPGRRRSDLRARVPR